MSETKSIRKFMIFGESGSGKTCYLAAMYNELLKGIDGYTISTSDKTTEKKLRTYYDKILKQAEAGIERFPLATIDKDTKSFNLKIQFGAKLLAEFELTDYPGIFLDPIKNNPRKKKFKEFEQNVNNASMIFICVDDKYLVEGTVEEKIKRIKQNCAMNINSYLGKRKKIPPVVIILTKYDLCAKNNSNKDINSIIAGAFEMLFKSDDTLVAIIPCSLGLNISDNNYTGELKPLNVHLPILLGAIYAFLDYIYDDKAINFTQKTGMIFGDVYYNEWREQRNEFPSMKDELEEGLAYEIESDLEFIKNLAKNFPAITFFENGRMKTDSIIEALDSWAYSLYDENAEFTLGYLY
mgnify:CR=1 FL=1